MKIKDILLDVSYFEKLENIDSLIEKRCIKIKNF
jgi:predicted RNA-binding protein with PIN domain